MVEGKLKFSTKFAFGVGQAGEGVCNRSRLLSFVLLQPDLRTESSIRGHGYRRGACP